MKLTEKIIDKCIRAGAGMAECFYTSSRVLRVSVRNGRVESIKKATPEGVAIRYFASGRMAFAYANHASESSIDGLISGLRRLADNASVDEFSVLPKPQQYRSDIEIFDDSFIKLAIEDKIDYVQNLESVALKFDPLITRSNSAWYEESLTTREIANSLGLAAEFQDTSYAVGLSIVAEKSGQMYPGEGTLNVRRFGDLPSPENIVSKFAGRALRLVGGTPVESGDYEVIFSPLGAMSVLWGLNYALNGEQIYRGESIFAGKLGAQVAAESFSVVDDPHLPWGPASRPADDEGVATSRHVLIDNGVFREALYDSKVAAKAKTDSTGSAHRDSLQSLPHISPSNLFIVPGTSKVDDLIASCKKGIIVEETQGWGLHSITGQYSAGIAGILVKNGKRIRPIGNVTLAAAADDLLNGIEAVADDLDIFNSLSSPTFKVKRMKVGS